MFISIYIHTSGCMGEHTNLRGMTLLPLLLKKIQFQVLTWMMATARNLRPFVQCSSVHQHYVDQRTKNKKCRDQ